MGKVSAISWTDATWNPWIGCHSVSPACDNCYARAWAKRAGRDFSTVVRAADVTFNAPLRWKDPKRIFVCSLSDFWHPAADIWREEAWLQILADRQHTFLILTKRPERIVRCSEKLAAWSVVDWVWLGVTAENQEMAEKRIPLLLDRPVGLSREKKVEFVSIEPMLTPVNLSRAGLPLLDWVIVGGESGPHRREMKIEWLEDVVAQCRAASVPVWVKQDSAFRPGRQGRIPDELWIKELPA